MARGAPPSPAVAYTCETIIEMIKHHNQAPAPSLRPPMLNPSTMPPPPNRDLPELKIGAHQVRYPIIQGGMGIRVSGAHLAAAVANAGGIGIISATGLGFNSPYFDPTESNPQRRHRTFREANRLALIDELALARRLSPSGVIGINVMMAARESEVMVQLAAAHGANLIIAGAGLPLQLPSQVDPSSQVALVPIVSSLRAAQLICRKWQRQHNRLPDALIVENPQLAGGHLGAQASELDQSSWGAAAVIPALHRYLNQVLEAPIPIIAAGGISSRADIDRMLELGASGVQIGTRFITTHECDADIRYKQFHLQAEAEDVVLVPSPVGLPGRALRNGFAEQIRQGTPNPQGKCLVNCLKQCKFRDQHETYCILQALDRAARGDVETGLVFAGAYPNKAQKMMAVAELMTELITYPSAA